MRVCLYFVLFCPLSCPLFCPFALVFAFLFVLFAPAFISFPAFLGLSSWLLGFCSWSCPLSLWVVVVSFSLTVYTQKERALRVGASSLVLLWVVGLLCKIWLPVLVKFVIINLDFFGYAFVRVSIFVIIPPLLEKTFKHTPDKFPCVKFIFYAFIYVI